MKTSKRRRRTTMTQLKLWMRLATPDEQEALAKGAKTSRAMLYHVANGNRKFAPTKAIQIERTSAKMHQASRGRLPKLYRTDMAAACAECEFALKCLGPIARRTEFPITPAV